MFNKNKKRLIVVPPKPSFFLPYFGEKMKIPCKNTCFPHPNGNFNFFKFPNTEKHNIEWQEGNIYLLIGEHKGEHHGFGIVHILQEHFMEIKAKNKIVSYENCLLVSQYISQILFHGSAIMCKDNFLDDDRPVIVKNKFGRVVLGKFIDPTNKEVYYSVITAFSNPNVKGHQIGSL